MSYLHTSQGLAASRLSGEDDALVDLAQEAPLPDDGLNPRA